MLLFIFVPFFCLFVLFFTQNTSLYIRDPEQFWSGENSGVFCLDILSAGLNHARIWNPHPFQSSSRTLHGAACAYPECIYSNQNLALRPSQAGMKGISGVWQLCLKQSLNIFHALAPIWPVTFPPWRAHHAYYCLLFWETPRRSLCRLKRGGFTECPPGSASQQLLLKQILPARERAKKTTKNK